MRTAERTAARPDLFATDEEWASQGFPLPGPDADDWVEHVRVVGPLTLWVEHRDGVAGHVRFLPSHLRGAFEVLKDPAYFARVGIEGGAVSWPNEEPDLAPDNMHRHLFAFGEWVLT